MDNTLFLAKSSGDTPYEVVFRNVGNSLSVTCTCEAGRRAQQCKHKRSLAKGDKNMLFDKSQEKMLVDLMESEAGSRLQQVIASIDTELQEIERSKSKLAAREKSLKSKLGDVFATGET